MKEQTILIIEDSNAQRIAQQLALEMRSFSVRVAGSVREAREAIKELGQRMAVMVLDMRLEDDSAPGVTGADLGLEVRASNPRRLPEFLILSAYSMVEYYKLADRLGVSAYVPKEDAGIDLLVRHLRALMIRRNLSMDDPDVSQRIAQIAEKSKWLSEAAARFCLEVMAPALSAFLGAPFVILLNDGRLSQVFYGETGMPQELRSLYEKLESAVHGRTNPDGPLILSLDILHELVRDDCVESDLIRSIVGAAFLPLPVGGGIRLSLGILPGYHPLAEDPKELALILSRYLHRSMLEPLLYALAQYLTSKVKREARQEAQLLAHSCSYIAEEQLAILSDAVNIGEMQTKSESFRQLMSLSEALRDTGQTLMLVDGEKPKASSEKTQMRELVQAVLEDLGKPWLTEKSSIEGDCLVPASRDDLFIAVSRILQWFAYRLVESLPGDSPFLRIVCDMPPEGARITFEDSSPRLPARLRQRLFSPFAQPIPAARGETEGAGLHFPLYLAKTLVELKQGGELEDRSDDLPGKAGHRFEIRFPNRR